MWRRLGALCARGTNKRRSKTPRLHTESLEHRAMLAATPVGTELAVTRASTAFADSELSAGETVFVPNGDTITISHSAEITGARVAGDDREIFIRRFSAEGELIGEPTRVNQMTRGDQRDPVIGAAADGSLLAVWGGRGEGDRQGIFARRFNADGTPAGDQFRINMTQGGTQERPDVAVAPDGTAVVTWHGVGDGDVSGVFAQRIGASDALVGSETLVNSSTDGIQGYSSVAMDNNGNYVIAWSSRNQDGDDWGIFAQRFDADGTAQGSEFAVNTTTIGSQHQADVDRSADGRFTIAWSSFEQDGDSWGVFAQRFGADGTPAGDEFQVNESTTGHQMDAAVALSDGGDIVVAWSDGVADGSGWEVNARTFDSEGTPDGEVVPVNQTNNGGASGHQRNPSIALDASGRSVIQFQGKGDTDRNGVLQQRFEVDVEPVENLDPSFADFEAPDTVRVGETLEVVLRATDPNSGDVLSFEFDRLDDTPDDATLVRTNANTVTVRWRPDVEDRGSRASFRILVSDDGNPSGADAVQFVVLVVNSPPTLDLNGSANGEDRIVDLPEDASEVALLDSRTSISDVDNDQLMSATVSLRSFPDLNDESLSVDTSGTSITATYNAAFGRLELAGADSVANYERVLESLRYRNSSMPPTDVVRVVEITVNDGSDDSNEAAVTVRLQGDNQAPILEPFAPITVVAGSPLHIPLNAVDLDGDELTYDARSQNEALLTTFIPEGNRSWRVSVEGTGANADIRGDMVFEFFEGRAPRATEQFIALTNDGFFEDIIFHRVINGFVIQGGDPTGTGTGGSPRGDFDDQFHVDLQHNRTGLLSMAKSLDDTNDSQFFVTEGPQRSLDFQHTIFGILVDGDENREAISNVTTGFRDRPVDSVRITRAEVFVDNQNGVLMLNAPEGVTGTVNVLVQVSDPRGSVASRTITVNIVPDTSDVANAPPFLRDIPTITTTTDAPTTFQLVAEDAEGDPAVFFDAAAIQAAAASYPNDALARTIPTVVTDPDLDVSVDASTGLLTITPQNGLTGTHEVLVAVSSANPPPQQTANPGSAVNIDYQVVTVIIEELI